MIECRAAQPDDWDISHPGWRARFAQFFGGKQWSGRGEVFVAMNGAEMVGCVVIAMVDDYRAFALNLINAHVNAVYVKPEYRRQGIARRLMRLAIDWARRRGCVRVRLRSSDDGVKLYESLGFRPGREMELPL